MGKNIVLFVFILLVLSSLSFASPQYFVTIKEHGEAVVIVEFSENGEFVLDVPLDSEFKGKGVIYVIEDLENSTQILVKAKTGGVFVYKTNSYTFKSTDKWTFNFLPGYNSSVDVLVPEKSMIQKTYPVAVIDEQMIKFDFTNNQNLSEVKIVYRFSDFKLSSPFFSFFSALVYFLILFLIFVIIYLFWNRRNVSYYKYVVRILPNNERKIVFMLKSKKGVMKRNLLEKRTKISKSSLTHALNSLEEKNIIKIDKSFTTHKIYLSRWLLRMK